MKTQHVEFYTESENDFFQKACNLLGIAYTCECVGGAIYKNEYTFETTEEQEKLVFNLLKYNYIHNILN